MIPPEFGINAYYVKDSFGYVIFKFVFMCGSYAKEARTSILRVIPLYENESNEFMSYIEDNGFLYYKLCTKEMSGEALNRLDNTKIEIYKYHGNSVEAEHIAKVIRENTNVVMNFAHPENEGFEGIVKRLRIGRMRVDWLAESRKLN